MNEIFERRLAFIFLALAFVFPACANKALGPVGAEKVSPLHEAVRTDNTARVKDLIATGAHINEADATGMTPLGIAVEQQNLEIVKMLLDRGANVNAKNAKGMTPMAVARIWEERSRKWEDPDATLKYRDVINVLKRYGGKEKSNR